VRKKRHRCRWRYMGYGQYKCDCGAVRWVLP